MRAFSCVVALIALMGCESQAQMETRLAGRDAMKCQSYGFNPGTEGYANCRMRTEQNRQRLISDALSSMAPRPVSCTSFGPTTTCY